jgi:hypothetical protein
MQDLTHDILLTLYQPLLRVGPSNASTILYPQSLVLMEGRKRAPGITQYHAIVQTTFGTQSIRSYSQTDRSS